MKQIPNLFTLLNLVFGCLAIIFIFRSDGNDILGISGISLIYAGTFIFASAVVDFLDGFVARLFKATSEMGAQLDSLADAVSFGVAPGMIIYKLIETFTFPGQEAQSGFINWPAIPALLIPCAAVWRLAKFNLDKEQTYYFKGLPSPAAGITIASLPLIQLGKTGFLEPESALYILYVVIIIISWLMVCNIPLISLKFKSKSLKDNIDKIILVIIALIAVLLLKWVAVPVILVAYIIVSLILNPKKQAIKK
ncbi:MAG: CDP-alcohol phosphatidyltransferase family protein [Sphingobacteriales bacterium]|nr:CDP-alcohol phosphatidyltransferase family protein [Sphingobacteriales bacterium]